MYLCIYLFCIQCSVGETIFATEKQKGREEKLQNGEHENMVKIFTKSPDEEKHLPPS